MNVSKKEKILLLLLVIVFVGYIYYQFGYLNLVKAVESKTAQEQEIESKYNNAVDTINKIDNQKSNVKILNAKIGEEAKGIYPTVSQEHIIVEIDKLLKDNGLDGGMEFDFVELNTVDVIKKSSNDKGDLESTMQASADKFNDTYGYNKNNENTQKSQTKDKEKSNTTSNTTNSATKENKKNQENKVIKMKGKVSFYGPYQSVVKFVKAIEERDKKICLFGISMDRNDGEWVKGEVSIGIYSVPKIDATMSDYLNWTLSSVYGKSEPFQLNQSAGNGIKATVKTSDFTMSAKPSESELPTIMMGKADDTMRSTYVYADKNDKEEAEIVLSKVGEKYYYKYKTSNASMPVDYSGNGCEFTPYGDSIVISVGSEPRIGDTDKSGLKLNIINKTGKLVKVEVAGDDKNNPRISIDGDNTNISVSQK